MNTGLNKIRDDINNIFILKDKEITDEVINYLNKTFFVMTDIMVLTNDAPCFKNDKFMLYILNQNINNIKYYNSNNPSEAIIDYLVNKNYVFKSCDNPILLNNRLLVDNVINMGDINDLFINDISLSQKQLDKIIEIIKLKNINIKYISNKYLVNNEEFLNELINLYKIKNPYLLSNYNVVSNIGRSLELGLNNIISRDGIEIIIRDLIRNNYYIDIISILRNINIDKLKELYNKINYINNIEDFDLDIFVKTMEYLSNNINLVIDINNVIINDLLINNLNEAIKKNKRTSYLELIGDIDII